MTKLTARLDLPPGVQAPKEARDAVESMLREWGFQQRDWLELARVVVSELVTNATVHGGGCLRLEVQVDGREVTIRASDAASAVPRRRVPGPQGGYGLALIEALVPRWGVDEHEQGKQVWVQLPAPPQEPAKVD
jgi:anti-sigma regulatory factor (Ser/Thr protein kinase)